MKTVNLVIYFCSIIFLFGCSSTANLKNIENTVNNIPPQAFKMEDLSPDIKLVTSAIIEKMRGRGNKVKHTSFNPSGKHFIEEKFKYEEFSLSNLVVVGYSIEENQQGQDLIVLEAILSFSEPTGRKAGVVFGAKYVLSGNKISILESVVTPLSPKVPELVTFFVPAKKLAEKNSDLETKLESYLDYFHFAIQNAVPMTKSDGMTVPIQENNYLIMTFCLDRLEKQSKLTMKVTEKLSGLKKGIIKPIYFDDQGWRIIMAGGEFKAGSWSSNFYVQLYYTASPEIADTPLKIAVYENKRLPRDTN